MSSMMMLLCLLCVLVHGNKFILRPYMGIDALVSHPSVSEQTSRIFPLFLSSL